MNIYNYYSQVILKKVIVFVCTIAHLYIFIHIYDSLNVKCLKEDEVFINRLFPNNLDLKITFETVQSQTNSYVISSL